MSKSILITGCSSGIGWHAALTLSARGYNVFATARNEEDVAMLQDCGLQSCLLDLNQQDTIDSAVKYVLEQTGGTLDYLYNNGAYGQPGALEDLPTEALRAQFETNLFGWHELTRQIIPVMRQQGHGRIVQCSSVLGLVSMAYRGAYNASKYAIEGYTDTLRLELKGTNIDVLLIEPGPINTQFRANAYDAFVQHIDRQNSHHQKQYEQEIQRLSAPTSNASFALEPLDVTRTLISALESKRPKLRYRVTIPTKIFAVLKRILPTRWLDEILSKG